MSGSTDTVTDASSLALDSIFYCFLSQRLRCTLQAACGFNRKDLLSHPSRLPVAIRALPRGGDDLEELNEMRVIRSDIETRKEYQFPQVATSRRRM